MHAPFFTTVLLLSATSLAWAGPTNPPAGPIASTYKTLQQVEPRTALNATNTPGDADSVFRITQSGSYYLTGNVTGAVGLSAIKVEADDVTIDLNGFALQGVAGSIDGIRPGATVTGFAIFNGHISDWGGYGVNPTSGSPNFFNMFAMRIENVTVTSCQRGISTGRSSVLNNCSVRSCTFEGLVAGPGSVVHACVATGNGGDGFVSTEGCTIENCSAQGNTGVGINVSGQGDTLVTACNSTRNDGGGINMGQQNVVTNSQVAQNGTYGVQIEPNSVIEGCQIVRNTGPGVTTPPLGFSSALIVRGCTISNNSGWGIDFSNVPGGRAYQNFLQTNSSGAINAGVDDDAPLSPTSVGAGPWDNIGT
jgi:parallel beta-helix repeat protein